MSKQAASAVEINPPVWINLLIGGRCRLHCPFCFAWQHDAPELSGETWARFLERLGGWLPGRPVTMSGGEPLLHPDIERIVRAASAAGLLPSLSTAGEPLDGPMALALPDWPLHSLTVSIDGLAATHDRLRGKKGLFRQTLNALDYLKEKRPEVRTTTVSVICAANVDELPALVDFLLDKPQIDAVTFQAIIFQAGADAVWRGGDEHRLWPPADKALAFLDWLERRRGTTTKIGNSPAQTALWRSYFEAPGDLPGRTDFCHVGYYNLTVKSDGGVYLCDFHEPIGNIADGHPRVIWQSETARAAREAMTSCGLYCNYLINCAFEDRHLAVLSPEEQDAYRRAVGKSPAG